MFCGSDVGQSMWTGRHQSAGREFNNRLLPGELNWWQPQRELFTTVLQHRQGLIVWLWHGENVQFHKLCWAREKIIILQISLQGAHSCSEENSGFIGWGREAQLPKGKASGFGDLLKLPQVRNYSWLKVGPRGLDPWLWLGGRREACGKPWICSMCAAGHTDSRALAGQSHCRIPRLQCPHVSPRFPMGACVSPSSACNLRSLEQPPGTLEQVRSVLSSPPASHGPTRWWAPSTTHRVGDTVLQEPEFACFQLPVSISFAVFEQSIGSFCFMCFYLGGQQGECWRNMFYSAGLAVMSHTEPGRAAAWLPSPGAGSISWSHFGCLPMGRM